MRFDRPFAAIHVAALATLMFAYVGSASKKIRQKRQLFHENLLPYFGGKIPDSAFRADRLALNMLNKEGISVPDGVLFEARPKESYHQSPRNDPELSNSILKMIHTPDSRYIPSEGKYEAENVVETTYKIAIPSFMNNYQLPKFRPVTDTIQFPTGRHANDNGLSITHFRDRLGGIPYYTAPQDLNSRDIHKPYVDQFNYNVNKITNSPQNLNYIQSSRFVCDIPGKMYPDPMTQCQVFHLCHYNGFKETFICPQGTRYDPTAQECRLWNITPCVNMLRPF